ncbi:MAG: precorrin-6y C5,15-methyltransferase (decarboxylating) subunit CbiE [Nitrospirota bacterium]
MNKIHVIGIGFRPLDNRAKKRLLASDDVLANSRLLDVFKNYDEYESVKDRIIVHGSVYEVMDYIRENYKKKKIALLAAGDPMFFGIGRLAIERFGQDAVEVCPDLSSMQVAFSRVRETSNNALLMSLHGGPDPEKRRKMEHEISEVPGLLEMYGKIAILTDKVNSPEKIAETIFRRSAVSSQLSAVKIYVCEKLGYDDERITSGTPEEILNKTFEHPNIVIIKGAGGRGQGAGNKFGLKETEIAHSKGLITKDEVRAVTLHKLRLPQEGVFWDIGAGSGSVSIEAARLCPFLKVIAIEKNSEQIEHIKTNKEKFKVMNLEPVRGEAPDWLDDFPAPDRVFIGGSAGKLDAIVKAAAGKMGAGIIVVNATTIETLNEAVQSLEKYGFEVSVSEVSISRSKKIKDKRHMSALNPIFIVAGEKN